jgi:cysteine desulfurase
MPFLRDEGWEVTVLPVDADGRVAPHAFAAALRPGTTFASLVLANNELGTLNPIAELARIARKRGVVFHTDAVQAPGKLNLDVGDLGVDLLSLSAHKFYGPKGSGALYVRSGVPLAPLVVGGGQEAGRRSGTENVAGIAGLAFALDVAVRELPAEEERLRALRDRFESGLATIDGVRINAAGAPRLPNISSVAFEGADATALLARLDLEGVAVSAGSACAAGSTEPSHVLAALDVPGWVRTSTIRFSFGKLNVEEDVTTLSRMLPKVVAAVRESVSYVGTSIVRPASRRPEVRS